MISPFNFFIISIKYFPGIIIDPIESICITCVSLTSNGKNVLIVISESLVVRYNPYSETTNLIPINAGRGVFDGIALLI